MFRVHDDRPTHDGVLQRPLLVLRVVTEVAQDQVGHQLIPVHLSRAACVYLMLQSVRAHYVYPKVTCLICVWEWMLHKMSSQR